VGDGLQGEAEGVFHAHRPRGGLLQIQHIAHGVGSHKCSTSPMGWAPRGSPSPMGGKTSLPSPPASTNRQNRHRHRVLTQIQSIFNKIFDLNLHCRSCSGLFSGGDNSYRNPIICRTAAPVTGEQWRAHFADCGGQ
jgi:hypothetical protein